MEIIYFLMHAIDLIVNDLSMHVYILNLVIFNQKVFFPIKLLLSGDICRTSEDWTKP